MFVQLKVNSFTILPLAFLSPQSPPSKVKNRKKEKLFFGIIDHTALTSCQWCGEHTGERRLSNFMAKQFERKQQKDYRRLRLCGIALNPSFSTTNGLIMKKYRLRLCGIALDPSFSPTNGLIMKKYMNRISSIENSQKCH